MLGTSLTYCPTKFMPISLKLNSQPRLMFAGKARAYPSEAPFMNFTPE
jgi:hypothetical protein